MLVSEDLGILGTAHIFIKEKVLISLLVGISHIGVKLLSSSARCVTTLQ